MTTNPRLGSAYPLGATVQSGSVNVSVYAGKAKAVELLLFDSADDPQPVQVIRLDAGQHRTYHYWHAFVSGVQAGQIYAYRASGPNSPQRDLLYDADKVLLDPYGHGIAMPAAYSRAAAFAPYTAYSSRQDPLGMLDEFRDMVKARCRAGIEVILDVVYNHIAEAFGGARP